MDRPQQPTSLVRHPDYLRLWSAETVSSLGTQITQLALPIIAATTLGVGPFEFGLVATMSYLPHVLIGLPAGVLVDRFPRRPILIASDMGRALSLASVPIAFALGYLTIVHIYLVAFVNGCLSVFFDIAYRSYLPSVVDRSQIVQGNSALEVSRSAAEIAGPGLAGLLIGIVRAPFALVLDAISFLVSGLVILRIRRPEQTLELDRPRRSVLSDVVEGLRYTTTHPWLRSMAATSWVANFFTNVLWAILILFLLRERDFTPELIGIALSIGSIGGLISATVNPRLVKHLGLGRTLILAAAGFSAGRLPLAFAPDSMLIAGLIASVFVTGMSGVVWNVNNLSLRQAIAPARMQGRLTATLRFIVWSAIPLGSFVGAVLGDSIGLHETIVVGAIGSVVAWLPVARSTLHGLHELPPLSDSQVIASASDGTT